MKILFFIIAIFSAWLLRIRKVIAFQDIDINVATFDNTNLLSEYKDPTSRQFLGKLGNNTAYNFRHSDQNLFIENDEYTDQQEKTYDTDRDYRNKYLKLEVGLSASAFTMPFGLISNVDALTTEWVQLVTSFQTLPKSGLIEIKANNTGGFTIRVTVSSGSRFLLGSITESRKVTGA